MPLFSQWGRGINELFPKNSDIKHRVEYTADESTALPVALRTIASCKTA